MKPLQSLPLEEVIKLPNPGKSSMMSLAKEEDILPTVAFKERRSIRTLTGLEEIQAHQRAGEDQRDAFRNICNMMHLIGLNQKPLSK